MDVSPSNKIAIILVVVVIALLCVLTYVFFQLPTRSGANVTTTPGVNVASQEVNTNSYVCKGVSSLYVINGTVTPTKEATATTMNFKVDGLDPSKIVAHHTTLSALATNTTAFGNLPFDAPSRSLTITSTGALSFTFISNSTNVHNYTLYIYL